MPVETDFARALVALKASGFKTNTHWATAHDLAQTHEGDRVFDAMHALCHRIEGDTANAAYWDRRAGTDFGGNGLDAELAAIEALAADRS